MLERPFRAAIRLVALVLLSAAAATPAQAQSARRVFVLAGQSNTWDLRDLDGTACASPGSTQTNVSYWESSQVSGTSGPWSLEPIPTPDVEANAHPMLTLGNSLGANFPNEQVELVMIAQNGSALLWRNSFTGGVIGAWIDELNPSNPSTWMNKLEPVMNALALSDGDILHIVWGQGESDCLPGQTTTTLEYRTYAQHVFAELAADAGKSVYDVHLVTLGAVYTPFVSGAAWNRVRDAHFEMPNNVIVPLPGVQATIWPAAHHYDLEHRDWVHMTPCESVTLASRIADGIRFPTALPLVSSTPPSIVGTTDIVIPTTVALAPMPFGQSTNKFFEVTVAGVTLSPSNFWVATSGASLIVRVKGGLTATNFSVRHVAGTGDALDWQTMPTIVDAVLGLPLEPFIAP